MNWIGDGVGAGILVFSFYAVAFFLFRLFFSARIAMECAAALTVVAIAAFGIFIWQVAEQL